MQTLDDPELEQRRLIGSRQVLQLLGVSAPTLERYVARADYDFPRPFKIGGRRFWRKAALLDWLAERERQATQASVAAE